MLFVGNSLPDRSRQTQSAERERKRGGGAATAIGKHRKHNTHTHTDTDTHTHARTRRQIASGINQINFEGGNMRHFVAAAVVAVVVAVVAYRHSCLSVGSLYHLLPLPPAPYLHLLERTKSAF